MNFGDILDRIGSRGMELDEFEEEIEDLKRVWSDVNLVHILERLDDIEDQASGIDTQRSRKVRDRQGVERKSSVRNKRKSKGPSFKSRKKKSVSKEEKDKSDGFEQKKEDLVTTEKEVSSSFESIKKSLESIANDSRETQKKSSGGEISSEMEQWIEENLSKGFGPRELKKSLKKNGKDPSLVDKYLKNQ